MSSSGKIKKLFAGSNVNVHSKFDERIINAALSELGESGELNITPVESYTTKRILTNTIIRLAAAALIIIAAVLAISLWERPATAAYAVEHTIEAMGKVNTIHCFMDFYAGEQYELWIEVDPQTGEFNKIFLDSAEVTKVATPNGISCYYKNTNEVSYFKLNSALIYKIYFKPLIQDMADLAKSNGNSNVYIIEGEAEKSVITVILEQDESILEWKVDSETKLPISVSLMSKEVLLPMKFNQSIYDFTYNVPLPEGIFDFKIPEGAKLKGE